MKNRSKSDRRRRDVEPATNSHYYSPNAGARSAGRERELRTRIAGIDMRFETDGGVFSREHIDFGSRVLIETFRMQVPHPQEALPMRIADLGCGYGAIGLTLAASYPYAHVDMADVNERAVALARRNAELNRVADRTDPVVTDLAAHIPPDTDATSHADAAPDTTDRFAPARYDYVLTNPPIRAGKAVVFAFYKLAHELLRSGGSLFVVIQKKQGAPSSKAELERLFGRCEIVNKDGGYWIFMARKS